MSDGGTPWLTPTRSHLRRSVFLAAAALCVFQTLALLLTALAGRHDGLLGAAVVVSLVAAAWAIGHALRAPVPFEVRVAANGGIELRADGAVLAAQPAHVGLHLLIVRTAQPRPRSWLVWHDTLPGAEFRRLVTAARWSRPAAAHDIGNPA